jgi:hypothetical protein
VAEGQVATLDLPRVLEDQRRLAEGLARGE